MSTVQKWNQDVAWATDSQYIIRCIEESFAPSGKGHPMITLKFEVVAPETMNVNGEDYSIAGIPIRYYRLTRTMDGEEINVEKSARNEKDTKELYRAFGLDDSNIDFTNPPLGFKGKTVYALLENKANEKHKSPTAEEIKKGLRVGAVLLNPITKQPLITNYPEIKQIYGLAEVTSGQSAF